MQMFSRQVQFTGAPMEIMAYATGMREYASEKMGQEIALWNSVFGAPVGSMAYTTVVNGVAGYLELVSVFAEDAEYSARIGANQHLSAAPAVDSLIQPIHGEIGENRPPVGACASVTSATVAPGKYEEAFAWGVDIAQHVESVSGTPTMVGVGSYGPFGQMAWIGINADPAAADAARNAVNSDADYMKKLGASASLFVPGSGNQTVSVRMA